MRSKSIFISRTFPHGYFFAARSNVDRCNGAAEIGENFAIRFSDEDDVRDGISRMGRKRVVSESRFENEKWKRKKILQTDEIRGYDGHRH